MEIRCVEIKLLRYDRVPIVGQYRKERSSELAAMVEAVKRDTHIEWLSSKFKGRVRDLPEQVSPAIEAPHQKVVEGTEIGVPTPF